MASEEDKENYVGSADGRPVAAKPYSDDTSPHPKKQLIERLNNLDYDVDAGLRDVDSEIADDDSDDSDVVEVAHEKWNQLPPANEFAALAKRLMKPIPDYPVKEETHHVWEIKDWAGLKEDKVAGPRFSCGGHEWNVLLFPRGNGNHLISIYMEPHPPADAPEDWYVCAQFALDIWNPAHPDAHIASGSHHRFTKNESDWGFSSIADLRQLTSIQRNHSHPMLQSNQINITGYVRIIDDLSTGVLWHSFVDYDSKKNTGFVGLNNQGATCYLNSLLQSYFTTKSFRKLVYQIPTDRTSRRTASVALALQRVFYLLSTSDDVVTTLELTKSFGWDSADAFTQHDVQEMNRILMDKLESAMKGSDIEGKLNDIFVGKMKSYIKCVNVDYESSRVEDFWDIQLNVKGFRNLQQAFENYIEIEMLEGENKYQAGDEHGYQDAKKGVVFQSFPPVLHLQLKRFEYDFMVDDLVKINDLYEYPDEIDLLPYLDEDLPAEVKSQDWTYKLHGVLVHQGSISNGHYYAMIKPTAKDDTWLRFDDDKVWRATPTQVFQENFGADEISSEQLMHASRAEQNEYLVRRATSAYMLVYYRKTELEAVLPDDEEVNKVIPPHIPEQIRAERQQVEKLERYKQEALHYINVKFVTVANFSHFSGFDLFPDPTISKLYDESVYDAKSYPITLKVKKEDKFSSLYPLLAAELGYEEGSFRLVLINHRNNHTNRADVPISKYDDLTVSQVYTKYFNRKYDEMVFYVEDTSKEVRRIAGPSTSPETLNFGDVQQAIVEASDRTEFVDIGEEGFSYQVFLKYFDITTGEVRGLTHAIVSKDDTISSLTPHVNRLLGFDKETPLEYFEELSQVKVDTINAEASFEKNELSNGDILVVQVAHAEEASIGRRITNIRDYYKFLLTRLHIRVEPYKEEEVQVEGDPDDIELATENSKRFDLWVTTQHTYQELAADIGHKIGVDPDYLKVYIRNSQGVKYALKSSQALSQFFPKIVAVSTVTDFEYEVLDITLKEYENMKSVKVNWLDNVLTFHTFDLLLPKKSTAGDLVAQLIEKLQVSEKQHPHILLWAGVNHKYVDLIRFDKTIESIDDHYELYAGSFPVEVEILTQHDLIKRYVDRPVRPEDFDDEVVKRDLKYAQRLSKSLNIIPVFHFHKNINYPHLIPFIFPVYPDEPFDQTKERLQRKLGLSQANFDKVKLALADTNGKGRYLDTENELNLFEEVSQFDSNVSLALDHIDRTPRRPSQLDKGISIK